MNSSKRKFAIQGGQAVFPKRIRSSQSNIPKQEDVEKAFRNIFSRRYYTNQGPLTEQLEERLCELFGVKHAICMTNETIAMIIAAKALNLKNKVICSGYAFVGVAQSLNWAGIEPVFCDINPEDYQLSLTNLESIIDSSISGIFASHLWGYPCSPVELQAIADAHNIKLYFDASHAFGCTYENKSIAQYGELSVFSFDTTSILNAAEGGCVTTNCDKLAARLRNIRSSYGAGTPVAIPLTGNGRMSEAQAALALLSLDNYHNNIQHNKILFNTYRERLSNIPGLKVLIPNKETQINYSYLVLNITKYEFGMSRDQLMSLLKAENIDCNRQPSCGLNKIIPYINHTSHDTNTLAVTEELSSKTLHLPIGAQINIKDAALVCEVIYDAHTRSDELRQ